MAFESAMTSVYDPLFPIVVEWGSAAVLLVNERPTQVLEPGRPHRRLRGVPLLGRKRLVTLRKAEELFSLGVTGVRLADENLISPNGAPTDVQESACAIIDVDIAASVQTVPSELAFLGPALERFNPDNFPRQAQEFIEEVLNELVRGHFGTLTLGQALRGEGRHAAAINDRLESAEEYAGLIEGEALARLLTFVAVRKVKLSDRGDYVEVPGGLMRTAHVGVVEELIKARGRSADQAHELIKTLLAHPDLADMTRRGQIESLISAVERLSGHQAAMAPGPPQVPAAEPATAAALPMRASSGAPRGAPRLAIHPDVIQLLDGEDLGDRVTGAAVFINRHRGGANRAGRAAQIGQDAEAEVLVVAEDASSLRACEQQLEEPAKEVLRVGSVVWRLVEHTPDERELIRRVCAALAGDERAIEVVDMAEEGRTLRIALHVENGSRGPELLDALRERSAAVASLLVYRAVEFEPAE